MKNRITVFVIVLLVLAAGSTAWLTSASSFTAASPPALFDVPAPVAALADDPSPPDNPVKLIFIHHSTGGNWLADPSPDQPSGGLGLALMDNNYYVSATNYGWSVGEDAIGDRTDIPNWPEWFTGPNSGAVMAALYAETGQNIGGFGDWTRMATDPGGENEIVMFKSCFPNSDLYGNPDDPPLSEPNDEYTVANAKAVYNDILTYFASRQDKLFIAVTAPPLTEGATAPERAANARAFNDWLVNDWLQGYPYPNVAVFDYYNVLTSNGGSPDVNDAGSESGNHHRWWNGAVQHIQTVDNNYAVYPTDDSHPSTAGHQKATEEFVPLLNIYYNRWKSGAPPTAPSLTLTSPTGGERWPVNSQQRIEWSTSGNVPYVGLGYSIEGVNRTIVTSIANVGFYTWTTPLTPTTSAQVGVASVFSPTTVYDLSDPFTLHAGTAVITYNVYLPLALTGYPPQTPGCPNPLTDVTINGPTSGSLVLYTFTADVSPADATTPITYTWSPAPVSGQGTASASYQWATPGTYDIDLTAENCGGTASDDHTITISDTSPSGDLIQPDDLDYLGAFRLPDAALGTPYTMTWNYGGSALTYYPDGDDGGPSDGYPGSLYGAGHAIVQPIGEIDIPVPVNSAGKDLNDLNTASFLQAFYDVKGDVFPPDTYWEIPRAGLAYLPAQGTQTTDKLYFAFANHAPGDNQDTGPTHGWCELDLGDPQAAGIWSIGGHEKYVTADYIFEIPQTWADAHASGRYMATGRFRDGGQSAMGPSLIASAPWAAGNPPISGTVVPATPLLLYQDIEDTDPISLTHYHHSDEWAGGAWLTAGSKSAVLFVGTKGQGDCWYGCPDGTDEPPWPPTCYDRGWWSTSFVGQFLFYDPADLAAVAQGQMESYEPQPYATLNVDDVLYHISGDQQKAHLGAAAFDRERGLLYVVEPFSDEDKPIVHVWQVQ